MKSFPIPVVSVGSGSHVEDVDLEYMSMPRDMDTYSPPVLPEPAQFMILTDAMRVLHQVRAELEAWIDGRPSSPIALGGLDTANLALVNQVLGEGEVSARIDGDPQVLIQESIFAGVWRVVSNRGDEVIADHIEVGAVPGALAAARAGRAVAIEIPGQWPPEVMNAPSILTELNDRILTWRPGMGPHVINLSLLPLSPQDISFLDAQLDGGNVLVLSRGYGNCRITSSRIPNCWRLVYYNSQDAVILDTIEIVDIPEVACAAHEDLMDSRERLVEVLNWVAQA
ncbi:Hydrogenase expression/formation protein HoxQ (plasmid) [Cupriavidus necator]|uniref:hydrogenase expression/formation protein n=1 Tax=Cupriavidus necator TaxID=106590 RepID=UPI003F73BF19